MKKIILAFLICLAGLSGNLYAKVTVVAALTDFASIASYVGGDRVEVSSIARSTADPHTVEVLPTSMVKTSRAQLYMKVGLGLDQWSDQIVDGSRNSKVKVIDCSKGITVLEKPTGKVDASMGDVHPEGNPHYWLDPRNGIIVAQTIATALGDVDPAGADVYQANAEAFASEINQKMVTWQKDAEKLPEHSFITYHSSWTYFGTAFGLEIAAKIEPVPGIPPTGSHLAKLVSIIQERKVPVIIQEPYFSDDAAGYLKRETGIKVIKISPSCEDATANSYVDHFQKIFDSLATIN